jgi:branched-chain amino acid transport system substrate-binding protein
VPATASTNAQTLLAQNVLGMVGAVGTAEATAMLGALIAAKVPLVAALTGARVLRSPYQQYVLNVRAGYDDEVAALMKYVIGRGLGLVSILYSNDAYGAAGYAALDVALKNLGLSVLSSATYPAGPVAVDAAWAALQTSMTPQVCACVRKGTALPLAKFVNLARSTMPNPRGEEG